MNEYIDNEEVVNSKNVTELITVAAGFCRFIEKIETCEADERIPFLQKMLTALYLKGLLFPTVEVNDDTYNQRFVTEEEYELLRVKLANCFADTDLFSAVDYAEGNNDSKILSFAEILADIYLDLKDFLLLYQSGTLAAQENAVASCRALFDSNWGYKLTIILPYLHVLSLNF
ncbi:MAG: DUF5063 domain-containing protein [Bacteroidales bacterium]|nr:DUF5063 domain-containing protein [Bacteroidales bacterium]MBQ7489028.1 DUF5063 domain-containing protein [Bacteroidales bacterium]